MTNVSDFMKDSLSIIVAAYNEEKNITNAVRSAISACKGQIDDYEIIVVDDGSTDKTADIVESLRRKNKKIKLIKQGKNSGFGKAFMAGVNKASRKYITGFPGDNDMSSESLAKIIKERKKADFVLSYMVNQEERSLQRQIISKGFILLMNLIFGLNLKYYNGYFVTEKKKLLSIPVASSGFSLFSEIIVKALKQKYSYIEVPFYHTGRLGGSSKAVSLKSIWETVKSMIRLKRSIK